MDTQSSRKSSAEIIVSCVLLLLEWVIMVSSLKWSVCFSSFNLITRVATVRNVEIDALKDHNFMQLRQILHVLD